MDSNSQMGSNDPQGGAEEDREESIGARGHSFVRSAMTVAVLAILIVAAIWFWWVFMQIQRSASQDEAAPADAIAVFGAAEYHGRPSPVLNARLEHALDLYRRKLAPVVITLGGGGGTGSESQYSEGAVGRDFFLAHGVPDNRIIGETASSDTEESVARLAAIARENHFQTIIVVSDGTHLFRIQQLCRTAGLRVLASPRETGRSLGDWEISTRYAHEMVSYTLWRMHLH